MSIEKLAQDNTAFALELYQQLRAAQGNLFFSPYSLSTALAMTYAGARGQTAAQMAQAARFSLSQGALHPAFATLARHIAPPGGRAGVQLKIANALWPQAGYPFLSHYLELVRANYSEQITPLDYGDPEAVRQVINAWTEEKTAHKIRDLIPPGLLNPLVRLVLTNAIYFKGDWAKPFAPELTHALPFQTGTGATVTASFMYQREKFGYGQQPGLQILELPYQDPALALTILLPPAGELPRLEENLTPGHLETWLRQLIPGKVDVFLPRFKFSAAFGLGQTLQSLGMTEAFDEQRADFSGMDGRPHWLYLGAVVHKAFVEVNETGTEAAAATAMVMQARSMPEKTALFRADRPFIFLIRDNTTGSILFLGRVTNPTL